MNLIFENIKYNILYLQSYLKKPQWLLKGLKTVTDM